MKIKYLFIFVVSLLLFQSCELDKIENLEKINGDNNNLKIVDGRLVFENKELFAKFYKKYADASDAELGKLFQPLYEKGFYSLRPIVLEENEKFLYEHYNKLEAQPLRKNFTQSSDDTFDYLDDLEDIIGDDAFAAFLNNEAEILVQGKIYKYTDVGLFIVPNDKYSKLDTYLDAKNISDDLIEPTAQSARTNFFNQLDCINNAVYSVIAAPNEPDVEYYNTGLGCGGGGYSPGSNTPAPNSPASSDASYNSFLNNLSSCSPQSGLFGNLFGDNNVCIDKYESKRRVKTKAFNYNYLLVYHLGVKCVHQFRGWTGFWRVEATSEIRLVVEAAQFEYDANAVLGNNAVNNQSLERLYFMNNQKVHYGGPNTINIPNANLPTTTYFNQTSLPTIFKDDLSFEFYSTGWDFLDSQIQNGINSSLNAGRLNTYFYNNLYSTAKAQLQFALGQGVIPPPNRTFVAKFPQQGKLIFQKAVLNTGLNIGVRQKTFDWGAQVSFNASDNGQGAWTMGNPQPGNILILPTNFRVKIIGAARNGAGWHGSKFNVGID